jgi:hypothetical protein
MWYLKPVLFVAVCLVVGCHRTPSVTARVQTAGGPAALKRDCQSYFAGRDELNESWISSALSNLPPVIVALHPQILPVHRNDGLPVVDIQVAGGFTHQGVVVVLSNAPAGFMPSKPGWRVTRIGDGVYAYDE